MKTPYWQITVESPRDRYSRGFLDQDKDTAMDVFFKTAKDLCTGQTAYLDQVDEMGFIHHEYTVSRG